jgi:hypothetical protein
MHEYASIHNFKQRVSGVRVGVQNFTITDRPNDPLSNSMFFQFMTRLDDRLKTIETNVTKSVGELDDIKKTVRSISGTVTTVQNEVKELSFLACGFP